MKKYKVPISHSGLSLRKKEDGYCDKGMFESGIMDLTKYKVKRIIYPQGELQLGEPADVIDEGGFYRIAGTHIIEKFKIEKIEKNGNRFEIKMKHRTVVLVV